MNFSVWIWRIVPIALCINAVHIKSVEDANGTQATFTTITIPADATIDIPETSATEIVNVIKKLSNYNASTKSVVLTTPTEVKNLATKVQRLPLANTGSQYEQEKILESLNQVLKDVRVTITIK